MECMDAGFRMYDGTPSPCPNCDAGARFEQTGGRIPDSVATVPRSELNPMRLPPGGDVMITEMKRQAAGLPVGVIGSEVLVRAQVEAQPLVHDLVRLVDDFTRDTPGTAERAVEALGGLPEWAIPDDVRDRGEGSTATKESGVPEPEAQVLPMEGKAKQRPAKPAGSSPAAPLEPPD
jgi:hypothetical protein